MEEEERCYLIIYGQMYTTIAVYREHMKGLYTTIAVYNREHMKGLYTTIAVYREHMKGLHTTDVRTGVE